MIVYLDSSVLVQCYLADEPGHEAAVAMLADRDIGLITGTWSRLEVSSALIRAARAGRGDEAGLQSLLDADLGADGPVAVIAADRDEVEIEALRLVRAHRISAVEAWHLATALLVLPSLVEAGEQVGFATSDRVQSAVASELGLQPV